jgi:hypothetical protein
MWEFIDRLESRMVWRRLREVTTFVGNDGKSSQERIVTGCSTIATARNAHTSLFRSRGYANDDVNLVMSDETRNTHFSSVDGAKTELGTKAAEGAGVGGAIGGTLGAIAAVVAAVGMSLAIPGLGVVIAGPLRPDLQVPVQGGAGGLVGALIGWASQKNAWSVCEMFEQVRESEVDTAALGVEMAARKRSSRRSSALATTLRKASARMHRRSRQGTRLSTAERRHARALANKSSKPPLARPFRCSRNCSRT